MTTEKQIVAATSKYIRISPSKVDLIIAKIRGKTYKEALQILKFFLKNFQMQIKRTFV